MTTTPVGDSVQRVRVICRRCGKLYLELHEAWSSSGERLVGSVWVFSTFAEPYRGSHDLGWLTEPAARSELTDAQLDPLHPYCHSDAASTSVSWREVWARFDESRRTGKTKTVRVG